MCKMKFQNKTFSRIINKTNKVAKRRRYIFLFEPRGEKKIYYRRQRFGGRLALTNYNLFKKYVLTFLINFAIICNVPNAGIAQLIERCLAKAQVAGLSPVSRSRIGSMWASTPTNHFFDSLAYNILWRCSQVVRHESAKL